MATTLGAASDGVATASAAKSRAAVASFAANGTYRLQCRVPFKELRANARRPGKELIMISSANGYKV
ncbi:hypothetical protein T281_11390 [Rhodomicrobium udaipurense JA643]|nr:hypothetical protein T281_11390 [Rhodomicrobium udaipurense JA643]